MTAELAQKLRALADRYERAEFLRGDPAQFMHRYADAPDVEVAALTAACLAFGRRDQILAHVEEILGAAGAHPADWVRHGGFADFFPDCSASFYRTYSCRAMRSFFSALQNILSQSESPGALFRAAWERENADAASPFVRSPLTGAVLLAPVIASFFPADCTLVPHSQTSAAKKLNMFLRWMVRVGSPVDRGLWRWYGAEHLLMPLDTHVMQQATALGLLAPGAGGKPKGASLKTALALTAQMAHAFPGDPARGDYALFGLGVDTANARGAHTR